jgi:AcrR family transcriptional regulator
MTENTAPAPAARRFSREDWIASARKVLVESGVDDVKIDRLARKMKVTRGSFYWHFQHHNIPNGRH